MSRSVTSVLGLVAAASLGRVLVHEHVALDMSSIRDGDVDVVLQDADLAASEVAAAGRAGIGTIVDATTSDVGRNVHVLRAAAERSGVTVVAGTGAHHAATYPHALLRRDHDGLVAWLVGELTEGIADTDVRAGVIGELGTSGDRWEPEERRVFRAAGEAAARTGAPVLTHTAEGALALEQLETLCAAGASPDRVLIGHLDCTPDSATALAVARAGAFVGIDRCGIGWLQSDEHRVAVVRDLVEAGYADRVLLSSDVARRSRLQAAGGDGYATVPVAFVPALLASGMPADVVDGILDHNPVLFLCGPEPSDEKE